MASRSFNNALGVRGDLWRATISATQNNVTGDGTAYTIIWNFESLSAPWASLDTGTGAITLEAGSYVIKSSIFLTAASAAGEMRMALIGGPEVTSDITTAYTYASGSAMGNFSWVTALPSQDTLTTALYQYNGTLTADLVGDGRTNITILRI